MSLNLFLFGIFSKFSVYWVFMDFCFREKIKDGSFLDILFK